MKVLFFVLSLVLFANCSLQNQAVRAQSNRADQIPPQTAPTAVPATNPKDDEQAEPPQQEPFPEEKISKGMLVLNQNRKDEKGPIRFFNEDGSPWYEFSFYYDDTDGKFDFENENFSPRAFHPDYYLLILSYAGEDKERYEVVVNEETHLTKYFKKSDDALKFEAWEEHLLNTFSVDFDKKANPVRDAPNGNIKTVKYRKGAEYGEIEHYDAVEVNGDWLKIEWEVEWDAKNQPTRTESGWIRWRKDGMLIIAVSELC